MLIDVFSGSETFPGASCKVSEYVRMDARGKDFPLFVAAKDKETKIVAARPTFIPASERNSNHGLWTTQTYDIPNGCFMTVHVVQSGRSELGFGMTHARLMLRVRDKAAYRSVRIPLTCHEYGTMSAGYIKGRFDIIPETLFDELLLSVPVAQRIQFEHDNVEDIFDVVTEEAELAPFVIPATKTITKADGKEIVVQSSGVKRRLKLR